MPIWRYTSFFSCAAAVVFMILQKHPVTYDATQSRNFQPVSRMTSTSCNAWTSQYAPLRCPQTSRIAASLLLGEYSCYSENFDYRIVDLFMETGVVRVIRRRNTPGDVFIERLTTNTQQAEHVVKRPVSLMRNRSQMVSCSCSVAAIGDFTYSWPR